MAQERTFTSYDQEQSKAYAQHRPDYHPSLYQSILDDHTSTGGQLDTLLDVGSGPGNVARALAPRFAHVIGLDPSEAMIAAARSLGGTTSISEPIRVEIADAEGLGADLSPPIQDSSVDLITAANAAHWFDMARFRHSAARFLKPGGSVVLWTPGRMCVHPSVPNAAAIQATFDQAEDVHLKAYMEPGNLLTRGRYADLVLPWTMEQPVSGFDRNVFIRHEWDIDEDLFAFVPEVSLDTLEKNMSTWSPVTRWHQAHPEAVGTDQDLVKIHSNTVKRLLHEAGVEKGQEKLKAGMRGVTLIVKKRA